MSTYDKVTLVPREVSFIKTRREINTTSFAFGLKLSLPLVASPMLDVCDVNMAEVLCDLNGLGIIHKFQSPQATISALESMPKKYWQKLAVAVNNNENEKEIKYDFFCKIG